ncbi:hypothetical protein [Clostridioides difficile]|uniref:hypothetical protein n=1 Tax=Clostridioides difficile TaxID=1496 RepID=UPI00082662EB|nr:hypothetical protein [Clostridioides difficile]MDO0133701.1 hypothetical protein [Clostridioides difficile]MDX5648966.1 hypothetical protein [Clostridioides difficile]HBG7258640.1 hypothetical protein [Clostridioides difficile]
MVEVNVNVKVKVEAPEFTNALLVVANALGGLNLGKAMQIEPINITDMKEEKKVEVKKAEKIKKVEAKEDVKEEIAEAKEEIEKNNENTTSEVKYTKEEVRTKAAQVSKAGKKDKLKELFGEFGASKLSEVKEEDYSAFMNKLENL